MKGLMYLCLTTFLCACGQTKEKKQEESVAIKVTQVTSQAAQSNREFTFISKPFKTTDLSFRVGGPIDRFDVYAGNSYRKGEVIAEIDNRDFRIRKERAESIYSQSKAEYERVKVLYEKNNLSASAYEKVRADYTSAKTAFETTVNELNDTRLIAPFDGYVGEVFMEKYQDVKATQPILSFIDIDQLRVEVYVPQDIAFGLQQKSDGGQNRSVVNLFFDANPDSIYRAPITEISKSTTRNNLSYLLTALLPNPKGKLLGGMSGKVFFNMSDMENQSILTIPQTALCHRPTDGDYVWVVDKQSNKATKRKITLGNLLPEGRAAIIAGLYPGETVASSGLRFLSEGTSVKISH